MHVFLFFKCHCFIHFFILFQAITMTLEVAEDYVEIVEKAPVHDTCYRVYRDGAFITINGVLTELPKEYNFSLNNQ